MPTLARFPPAPFPLSPRFYPHVPYICGGIDAAPHTRRVLSAYVGWQTKLKVMGYGDRTSPAMNRLKIGSLFCDKMILWGCATCVDYQEYTLRRSLNGSISLSLSKKILLPRKYVDTIINSSPATPSRHTPTLRSLTFTP